MLRFINCSRCSAQVEALPGGTTCWSCGHAIPGEEGEMEVPAATAGMSTVEFVPCKLCNAQVERGAARCWDCGGVLNESPRHDNARIMHENKAKLSSNAKVVPFSNVSKAPPPRKQGFLDFMAKAMKSKPDVNLTDNDPTDDEKEEERQAKRSRTLILFHCPKCNEYFKVIFKKVHGGVKCPVCKDVKMKVPFFCTRCKETRDFDTLDRHVCKTCNIDLILDPNYE